MTTLQEYLNNKYPNQEDKEQVKTILQEFYKTNDIELKYQISLRLPESVEDFPADLQEEAAKFLADKKREGIANNISELEQVEHIKSSFFRRLLLLSGRLFAKKGHATLKQR